MTYQRKKKFRSYNLFIKKVNLVILNGFIKYMFTLLNLLYEKLIKRLYESIK